MTVRSTMLCFVLFELLIGINTIAAAELPVMDRRHEMRERILSVGPGKEFALPSVAASFAEDGDVVEIDAAGIYDGDEAVWKQSDIIIRGVNGRPHLKGGRQIKNEKAIWVLKGDDVTIENIEFSDARVADENGAGIRLEGTGLTVRNCYFHHNENGILTGADPDSDILIDSTVFAYNGYGDGKSHNIYIGRVRRFTLRYSASHHAIAGHNVKSRAQENYILYNRIMDENDGTASYAIDLPNGGLSYLIGNVIQQGRRTENWTLISYGVEGMNSPRNELFVINNTLVNDRQDGVFIKVQSGGAAEIVNNIFVGNGKVLDGQGRMHNNIQPGVKAGLRDRARFDYRLVPGSPAIDAGRTPGSVNGFGLRPDFEYTGDGRIRRRAIKGEIDIGAYEFSSGDAATPKSLPAADGSKRPLD